MIVEMANYLSECPEFSGSQVCVNYLAESEGSASLKLSGNRENIKEYADGGVVRSAVFTLSVRENFALSQQDSRCASEKCLRIEKWVAEQNKKGILPIMESFAQPIELRVAKRFSITSTNDFLARYETQIELIYYTA